LPKRKSKITKFSQFLLGYCLGFSAWLAGLHCLEADAQGNVTLSTKKLLKYLFKLFLWTLEIVLVYQLLSWYRRWIMQASPFEISTAILVKSVAFLYIKVFWPRVFPEILPGLHYFLCPQCYQKQTFRFLPVSLKYGFFVTYLCRYCSCLVNAWGEQVFYPLNVSFEKILPSAAKALGPVVITLFLGFFLSSKILGIF
jgi:hypothetical protein